MIPKILSIKIAFVAIVALLASFAFNASAQTRSYMTSQVLTQGAYGSIEEIPQNQGGWVIWPSDSKTIIMSDGTQWRYLQDNNGYHHYTYAGTTGVAMPNTQYNQAVFNHDYSTMAIYLLQFWYARYDDTNAFRQAIYRRRHSTS